MTQFNATKRLAVASTFRSFTGSTRMSSPLPLMTCQPFFKSFTTLPISRTSKPIKNYFHTSSRLFKRKDDGDDQNDIKDDDPSRSKDKEKEKNSEEPKNGRIKSTTRQRNEKSLAEVQDYNSVERISIPEEFPQLLPIPLTRRPLFPGFYKSLYIKDKNAIQAITNMVERRRPYIGIFLSKDQDSEADIVRDINEIHKVGVFAQITNTYQTGPDSSALTVVVYPHRRIRIKSNQLIAPPSFFDSKKAMDSINASDTNAWRQLYDPVNAALSHFNVSLVNVENLKDQPFNPDNRVIRAITAEIVNVLKEISMLNPLLRDQIVAASAQAGNILLDPPRLADFAAAVSAAEPSELQDIIESLVIEERLHKALVLLKKELANSKLQQEISREVDKKITRKQQEYFLMEQLKGIKKELGMEGDGKDKLIQKFKEKAAELKMPEQVKTVFDEEIRKLQATEPAASEFNVTRNYLDWLTQIPWGIKSTENFDLERASNVLDEDHYGLQDVKDRILEFIAVGKLCGTVEGKIILMVGPPGVGKTSVGKSIARALGREFYRFSVGGLSDVAEIKGHRRTYVGAMPGKVVQALKKVKTENPLIMIDEVDKLVKGHQGDPASALLELLDPEQNSSFLDHYMDVPIDLSKVLFICTANSVDTIPGPLLDRMEVIRISGYVAEEKIAIAQKYLAPVAKESAGLKDYNVQLTDDAIATLIKQYCRESGVRNLKKYIDKVYRKAAYKIVKSQEQKEPVASMEITSATLKDFVGLALFTSDRMYASTPPGVVMGLAWTSMGGTTLYIESVLESALTEKSKRSFRQTGQMGDVMKESSMIAYTFVQALFAQKFPENSFFDRARIHMHVPEGATPKDGPSAGCTMATSLISLAFNRPVIPDVAMTGELTLTGKILKIGGVKEKAIAAKRSGVKKIIFPKANQSSWEELPDYIREGLEPHFVEWYHEIFDICFPK